MKTSPNHYCSFSIIISLIFMSAFIFSCKKPEATVAIPSLITGDATSVTDATATVGGHISSDGGSVVLERGICYGKNHNPVISDFKVVQGSGTGDFQCLLSGLEQNTQYYARAFAANSAGVGYGSEVGFVTLPGSSAATLTDIDGNVYKTVQIGTQTWMAENLKVTHYRDGSAIPEVSDSSTWVGLSTGAYCWYNNDSASFKMKYGALYNWYTVTDSRQLCPAGWHIPTDMGWKTLTIVLGGDTVAGAAMKSENGWDENGNGTNSSGFNGLPGGARSNHGRYLGAGWFGPWWSSNEYDDTSARLRSLYCCNSQVDRSPYDKHDGLAVRCVKD